jgi:hypothetical protein
VDTIIAVYSVLQGLEENTTQGSTYFYAPGIASDEAAEWFEDSCQYVFEFEGHRFFKNKED